MIVTAGFQFIVLLQWKSMRNDGQNLNSYPEKKRVEKCGFLQTLKVQNKRKRGVHILDRIFRYLAPLLYAIFCITYFGYYLSRECVMDRKWACV